MVGDARSPLPVSSSVASFYPPSCYLSTLNFDIVQSVPNSASALRRAASAVSLARATSFLKLSTVAPVCWDICVFLIGELVPGFLVEVGRLVHPQHGDDRILHFCDFPENRL